MLILSQIFSSVGVGLLVGFLVGLSSAPVVGLLVGAITALLASFLGLQSSTGAAGDAPDSDQFRDKLILIGLRGGMFSFACLAGVFAGLYMRTHNVLSPPVPSLKEQYLQLTEIGFSRQQARELVFDLERENDGQKSGGKPTDTILFSLDATTCDNISVDRFDSVSSAASYYNTMQLERLASTAELINEGVSKEETKKVILNKVVELLCEK